MALQRHFGKVVQLKKGVTIDRDKTSINLNENMDSLVPASKISDMPTGWICGQSARDFIKTKTGRGDSMNIQESAEFQTSKFYCKTDFDMKRLLRKKLTMRTSRYRSSTPSHPRMPRNESCIRIS